MGDMAEDFKFLNEQRKTRHQMWHEKNMAILELNHKELGEFEVKNHGEHIIIREQFGKPRVDFYPSTGRWRARGKMFSGGAKSMLNWYRVQ